jgi:hypothetical protein
VGFGCEAADDRGIGFVKFGGGYERVGGAGRPERIERTRCGCGLGPERAGATHWPQFRIPGALSGRLVPGVATVEVRVCACVQCMAGGALAPVGLGGGSWKSGAEGGWVWVSWTARRRWVRCQRGYGGIPGACSNTSRGGGGGRSDVCGARAVVSQEVEHKCATREEKRVLHSHRMCDCKIGNGTGSGPLETQRQGNGVKKWVVFW